MSEEHEIEGRWRIPESWHWSTMGRVADVIGGGTPSTSDPLSWKGDVAWVTPADLSRYSAKSIAGGARNITERGLATSGARMLPAGTILMSSRAPVGYVAIAANALSTNQGFKSFVLRGALLPDFAYWYLKGNRDLLNEFASGTTFPEVSGRRAAEIPVPIAPIAEQGRIVAVIEEHLSDLDAAVAGLERAKLRIARLRESILTAEFRDDTWPQARLGSIVESGPDNGLYLPKTAYGSGTPILRIDDYQNFWSRASSELRRVQADEATTARYRLRVGDLVVNRVNSPSHLGKCLVVEERHVPALFESNMMRMRLDAGTDPNFVALFLRSQPGRGRLTSNAKWAVNQASINQGDVCDTLVPLPPVDVQKEVASRVLAQLGTADRTAAEVDVQCARARRLRQSILKRAFEGKLVPQDPSEESASALLARTSEMSTAPGTKPRTRGPRSRPTARSSNA